MSEYQRTPIGKTLRFEIFKRDGFACQYCGAHPSETVVLEIDHIHPVAEGGTNDPDNLITACHSCNRGKGAVPLSVVPQSLEAKAAEVAEREEQIRAYYQILAAAQERKEEEIWAIAEIFIERFKDEDGIRRTYLASIRQFLNRLNFFEVAEAMQIACDRLGWNQSGTFRYFCGICWNKIRAKNGEEQ